MKEIAKSGGGPLQHHQRWKTQLRADDGASLYDTGVEWLL